MALHAWCIIATKEVGTQKGKVEGLEKHHTEETKQKLSKKVEINGVVYNSCTEVTHTFSVNKNTISNWIKSGKAKIINDQI